MGVGRTHVACIQPGMMPSRQSRTLRPVSWAPAGHLGLLLLAQGRRDPAAVEQGRAGAGE